MAFSALFGKKKGKESEPGQRPPSDASPSDATRRPAGGSNAANAKSPPVMSPRDVARATAEKIDLIESQIESEIMQSRGDFALRTSYQPPPQASTRDQRPVSSIGHTTSAMSTDIMLGGSHLAHSMVLADGGNPILEEAAILYANGQDVPAVAVLSAAVGSDRNPEVWLMLLELYQSLDRRAEFETLAIDFAVYFETSAPAWREAPARKTVTKAATPAPRAAIVFKGALDIRIVPQLEELKKLAQRHPLLHLEFDQVTSVDPSGADLILRVFAAFEKSNHEVAISGAGSLADRLCEAIVIGRRDASQADWMLLFEIYRILGRQAEFEKTSIDYCVTFEVSPPSWEPASPKYLLEDQAASPSPAEATPLEEEAVLGPDHLALTGELIGKVEAELQRLTAFANDRSRVVVDCAHLSRVDFTAAGLLLNWSVVMRGSRKQIEFINVGHLVAALFVVMGLHEVVPIERRKV